MPRRRKSKVSDYFKNLHKEEITFECLGRDKPYQGKEDDFQIATAKLIRLYDPFAFHVANERKTKEGSSGESIKSVASGAKLKRKGVLGGVSDWLSLLPRKDYHGLVIELKANKNTLTESQINFLNAKKKAGYAVFAIWSLDEFIRIIEWYFKKVEQ